MPAIDLAQLKEQEKARNKEIRMNVYRLTEVYAGQLAAAVPFTDPKRIVRDAVTLAEIVTEWIYNDVNANS
jgi:hypothetical protein